MESFMFADEDGIKANKFVQMGRGWDSGLVFLLNPLDAMPSGSGWDLALESSKGGRNQMGTNGGDVM